MKIYAFSDEAASDLGGQIAAMKRNGLNGTEIRGVNGRSIVSHTVQEAKEILRQLKDNGLSVWSVGSPIGKIPLDGDFAGHLDLLRHTLELANTLECANLRMFSFYLPEGAKPEDCRNEVIDKLAQMAETAEGSGVALCHENEKGIYGDLACRCAEILDAVPSLRCVFDPANFIQCGDVPAEQFPKLNKYITYMHIKDALLEDGSVVPCGKGDGTVPSILDQLDGEEMYLSVEPHLTVFKGLENLQGEALKHKYTYPDSFTAFQAAVAALKDALKDIGFTEGGNGTWIR